MALPLEKEPNLPEVEPQSMGQNRRWGSAGYTPCPAEPTQRRACLAQRCKRHRFARARLKRLFMGLAKNWCHPEISSVLLINMPLLHLRCNNLRTAMMIDVDIVNSQNGPG
eukprot:5593694-Amphidinium_carterae.1